MSRGKKKKKIRRRGERERKEGSRTTNHWNDEKKSAKIRGAARLLYPKIIKCENGGENVTHSSEITLFGRFVGEREIERRGKEAVGGYSVDQRWE